MIDSISKSGNSHNSTFQGQNQSPKGKLVDQASQTKALNPESITPNSDSTNRNAKSSNTDKPLLLLELVKQLPKGQTLEAQVKSSQVLSNSEKTLLQQSNPSLALKLAQQVNGQSSKLNSTIDLTHKGAQSNLPLNSTSPASAIKQALQNTTLFLAKVSLSSNGDQNQALTTITPLTLKEGDLIRIEVKNQNLFLERLPQQHIQQSASNLIKKILPQQQPINVLQQFVQQLQLLPKQLQTQILTTTTIKGIQALGQFTQSDKTVNTGEKIKQAIAHSGIQLENKIVYKQSIQSDLRTVLSAVLKNINNNSMNVNNGTNNLQKNPQKNLQNNPIAQAIDLGVNFYSKETEKLLSQLLTHLSPSSPQASLTTNLSPQNTQPQTATAMLMRLFGMSVPPEGQAFSLPRAIEQHFKLLVEKTQARIQLNQFQSLGLDKVVSDSRVGVLQQFFTEIPLRFNEQVLNLQIAIQERDYSQENNSNESHKQDKDEEKDPSKHWQVFMTFDLPNDEHLHTRLNIINDKVSATLWAESDTLCRQTKKHINVLRDKFLANGLTVEELVCLKGKPPENDTDRKYNLVDIQT